MLFTLNTGLLTRLASFDGISLNEEADVPVTKVYAQWRRSSQYGPSYHPQTFS